MYEKHIFVCTNQRTLPKSGCGDIQGHEFRMALKQALKDRGMIENIRVNQSGCLGFCTKGIVMVIYPEGIWYQNLRIEDLPAIVDSIVSGKPALHLQMKV